MSEWNFGYITDINYTYGYYAELNPLHMQLAFLNQGLIYPQVKTACELGYGQGMTVNINAATSTTQWFGTDFNPSQAAFAQEFGQVTGAQLFDNSFEEFAKRTDLPDFDFIAMHGIWSWVSLENKKHIIDFVKRKLKVGGVFYVSYNTYPGWSAFAPVRHLLAQYTDHMTCKGTGILENVGNALDFVKKVFATDPAYCRLNPIVPERLKGLEKFDNHYLAHEYLNKDWVPNYFAEMVDYLDAAKLEFACSANFNDHIDALNLRQEQQDFLKEIKDTHFRETMRDFLTNQQFRRDYWVKGIRKMSKLEQNSQWRRQRIILSCFREAIKYKFKGAQGEVELQNEALYQPILDILADYKPHTVGELEQKLAPHNINFQTICQVIFLLAGSGYVVPIQSPEEIAFVQGKTDRCNRFIRERSCGTDGININASSVIAGGFNVDRFQQLFLLGVSLGKKTPQELTNFALAIFKEENQKILKDGQPISDEAEGIAELTKIATTFLEKQLPYYKNLGI